MINSKNKKSQKRIIVEVIIDLATVQVAVWEIRIVGICQCQRGKWIQGPVEVNVRLRNLAGISFIECDLKSTAV